MHRYILLILALVITISGNSFAAEEEEAQTRPRPLIHQQKVSIGNHGMTAKEAPKGSAGQLFSGESEEEEAQTRPNPLMTQKKVTTGNYGMTVKEAPKGSAGQFFSGESEEEETQTRPKPLDQSGMNVRLSVPDEEETGRVAPLSTMSGTRGEYVPAEHGGPDEEESAPSPLMMNVMP